MPEILDPVNLNRLPQYTVLLMLGIVFSLAFMVWWMRGTYRAGRVIDVCLAGGVLGVIVARGFHVALNWTYFSANTAEITRLRAGGLDWHGAVIGAVIGMWIMAKLRGVNFRHLLIPLTFVLPFMGLMGWWGCYEAFCSYGMEVDNLSNYPAWQVWEARDIFNMIEPRFRTQQIGMSLNVALFGVMIVYVVIRIYRDLRRGNPTMGDLRRGDLLGHPLFVHPYNWAKNISPAIFWLILAVFSAGMFGIGEMRGDFAEIIYGIRADQWLDITFSVISLKIALVLLITHRNETLSIGEQIT